LNEYFDAVQELKARFIRFFKVLLAKNIVFLRLSADFPGHRPGKSRKWIKRKKPKNEVYPGRLDYDNGEKSAL